MRIIFLTLIWGVFLIAQDKKYWIQEGLEFSFHESYLEAQAIFGEITRIYPEDPEGYLLQAGLLDLYMLDYSTDGKEKVFFQLLDKAIKLADKKLKESKDSMSIAQHHFFKGASLSYKAMRLGRKKKYIPAINYGLKAVGELSMALAYDSTLYDAYLGLGVYDYAISELPKLVKWLLRVEDRREKGLGEIRLAAQRGYLTKIPANDALSWVLAYQGKYREAIEITKKLIEKYPESRSFRWTLAYALRRSGRWQETEKIYEEILYLVLEDQIDYPYNIVFTMYWLAKCKFYLQKYSEALLYTEAALIIAKDSEIPGKLKTDLEKLKQKLSSRSH